MTEEGSSFSRLLTEKNILVPMPDGTRLATDVYRPETNRPLATLLQRTPYDKDVSSFHNFTLEIGRMVEAGYAVVIQDVRGRFQSEGEFEPFATEGRDGAATIAWIAAQSWSDGQIGMFGASYYGATQWQALEAGAKIGAIAPGLTSKDIHRGWGYQGGAFLLGFNLNWILSVLAPGELMRRIGAGVDAMPDLQNLIRAVDEEADSYALTPLDGSDLVSRVAPYYSAWLRNPGPGPYWHEIEGRGDRSGSTPSLNIGGWYDIFLAGTIDGHTRAVSAGEASRLVIGPWAHGNVSGQYPEHTFGFGSHYQALDPTGMHLQWFDEHLRGRASSESHPPVKIFVMGVDEWWDMPSWPPPDMQYRSYFLQPHETGESATHGWLTNEPSESDEPCQLVYNYDPRDPVPTVGGATFLPGLLVSSNAGPRDQSALDERPDVLSFSTAPLAADLAVLGPVEVVLWVSSSTPDTDFTAKLMDVHPDGRAVILADGIIRARYRDGLDCPTDLRPDTLYEVRVDLVATANVFRAGNRIRLDVSSSNFPKFDRNLNTGGSNAEESIEVAVTAENSIHIGSAALSRLVLPCVPLIGQNETGRE